MAGTDLLDTPTDTVVAQRSETGQGILGAKVGKGMWVWSAVVLEVLSSRMSAGGCSLTGRRDNAPCLDITANLLGLSSQKPCVCILDIFCFSFKNVVRATIPW